MENVLENPQNWFEFLGPNRYLQATAIILAFIVLAKIADIVLSGMVRRIVKRTKTDLDDQVISALHRPVFASVALFGLSVATYRLELSPEIHSITVSILQTIVIIVWLRFTLVFFSLLLNAASKNPKQFGFAQKDTVPLLRNLAVVFIMLAGAYSILVAWDINVTGLVASAGIVGLALSFAAQDTLSHLFAGVAILADRPYKIGDYVVLDTGERGEVTAIGLRSTRLLTRDDVEVTVPNGVMGSAKIVNESGGPYEKFRVKISVGVAYGSDIDRVMQVLHDVATTNEKVCKTPEPRVRFRAFGASSLDFVLLCWIERPALRGLLMHELNCEIYRQFAAAGITIPFPQQDVHIKQLPGDAPADSI
ncbi:MAG: mechanosensitive ion channel family protein [Gammaproteobacteria bacterium]